MAEITEKHFRTWEKLSNYIGQNFTYFNRFIYRGHSNADWKLESTLTRVFNNNYKEYSLVQKEILVKKHLNSFRKNIRGRLNIDLSSINDDEMWALGQHFGLFTPLLDWSESPYVALFFALESEPTSKTGCLWALSENFIEEFNSKKGKYKLDLIRPLTNANPRLVSQQGLFLRAPIDTSLENVIKRTSSNESGVSIFKLTFEQKVRKEFLSALNNMNINKLTLYPDIMGSALHSNYIFEIEPYLKIGRGMIWDKHRSKLVGERRLHYKVIKNRLGLTAKFIDFPISVKAKTTEELKSKMLKAFYHYLKINGLRMDVKAQKEYNLSEKDFIEAPNLTMKPKI